MRIMAFCMLLAGALAACEGPTPIKNAAGERIAAVELREETALGSEPREIDFHGDTLKRAVESMDQRGVFGMNGAYEAKGVLHESTLVVVVRTTDDRERRIVVKDCAEPHVCGFLADMEAAGRFERKPLVCRSSNACSR